MQTASCLIDLVRRLGVQRSRRRAASIRPMALRRSGSRHPPWSGNIR